jgi:uncharacterized protein
MTQTAIHRRIYAALCALSILASAALAQTYPDYTSTTVNDFADLLPAAEERQLSDRLARLERETGVEMTVVTLPTQGDYAPNASLREFATGLFDHWGIGKADTNDGVLVLILPEDRAMRLELGAAYARDWDRVAQQVVDGSFLPAFRNDDYVGGILRGSEATIERIVMPFHSGSSAPSSSAAPSGDESGGGVTQDFTIFGAFLAIFALAAGRRLIGDQLVRLRRCPSCGRKGLSRVRNVLTSATRTMSGRGETITRCRYCDHEERSSYVIPRRGSSSSGGGSFGGGRSGGGGASGRW